MSKLKQLTFGEVRHIAEYNDLKRATKILREKTNISDDYIALLLFSESEWVDSNVYLRMKMLCEWLIMEMISDDLPNRRE